MQLVSHLMMLVAVGTSALCEPATSIMGITYRKGGVCGGLSGNPGQGVKSLIISGKCIDVSNADSLYFGLTDGWCWGFRPLQCDGLKREMNFTKGCNALADVGNPKSIVCRLPVY